MAAKPEPVAFPATLHRRTSGDLPVRIEIDEWSINAYREEPAQVIEHRYDGDQETISVEPTLSKYLTEEPVMTIRKAWSRGDFVVDFSAGFQRGRITVGRRELTTHATWPSPSRGYLSWIGLRASDREVREWLRNDSVMGAALAKLEKETSP